MFGSFVLIIMVLVQGSPATVSEHKFNTMASCIAARNQAIDVPFKFSREIHAFCVEK